MITRSKVLSYCPEWECLFSGTSAWDTISLQTSVHLVEWASNVWKSFLYVKYIFILDDNNIMNIEQLCHSNMISLKKIYIEFKNSAVIGEDLSWLSKMKIDDRTLKAL